MIWKALERVLGTEADRRVGMILAYTPDEWDIDDIIDGRIIRPAKA